MRLDPIIQRRFAELRTKADAIIAAKVLSFTSQHGKQFFAVPIPQFKEWATNVLNLLGRTMGENSPHFLHFTAQHAAFRQYDSEFENCYAIFKAAAEDYEGGYLFNVRTLAKAEVLADALQQAKELMAAGYKDPACILARVALEAALKDLAARHGVAEAKLDKMNADLCKAGAYNMAKQKLVTAWAEIGNKAAHGEWGTYTEQDAAAMVNGVEALVADL